MIAVGSNYGGEQHPSWCYNLLTYPECELGGEAFYANQVTDLEKYGRPFTLAERVYAGFADYLAKSELIGRRIPILRLIPWSRNRGE